MALSLLICGIVVILSIASYKISNKFGIPTLVIFILLGIIFGSDGVFKIPFENYELTEQVCSVALILIMFYGGFSTNWKVAKPVASKAIWLSTLGVIVTAVLTGMFCYLILGFEFLESILIGSVISSTDAASVFSILRAKRLNLKYGVASLLEIESGSNDPMSYMLTISVLSLMNGEFSKKFFYMLFSQVFFGILCGVIIAVIAIWILKNSKILISGLDTILVVAIAIIAYALPTLIGGNGYLSAYLVGIIMGNSSIKNKITLVHFFDGVTGLAQILLFFLLGLLSFPSEIPKIIIPALATTLFLTFIARPIAVFSILGPMKSSLEEKLLVSCAGLRGAASIVFAIMVTIDEAYLQNDIFHIVFCVALFSVTFQGTLLPYLARKLSMVDNEESVLKTFNDYQEDSNIQFIETHVNYNHNWIGKSISELELGFDTLIVMIKRGKEIIIPKGNTVVNIGDIVVLSGRAYKNDVEATLEEIKVEKGHKWEGKRIKELSISEKALVILIIRLDGSTVIPRGSTFIKYGDTIVVSQKIKK